MVLKCFYEICFSSLDIFLSIHCCFSAGGPDGSGGWFAPEVYLKGRKTMAVDLFSAGCMIFWVVSDGSHPFDNNPFNVVQGHYQKHILHGKPEVNFH